MKKIKVQEENFGRRTTNTDQFPISSFSLDPQTSSSTVRIPHRDDSIYRISLWHRDRKVSRTRRGSGWTRLLCIIQIRRHRDGISSLGIGKQFWSPKLLRSPSLSTPRRDSSPSAWSRWRSPTLSDRTTLVRAGKRKMRRRWRRRREGIGRQTSWKLQTFTKINDIGDFLTGLFVSSTTCGYDIYRKVDRWIMRGLTLTSDDTSCLSRGF